MNNKYILNFESAKLLKKVNFFENCEYYYDKNGNLIQNTDSFGIPVPYNNKYSKEDFAAPDMLSVIDFIYNKYGLFISIDYTSSKQFKAKIIETVHDSIILKDYFYSSYQEALQETITKCLNYILI